MADLQYSAGINVNLNINSASNQLLNLLKQLMLISNMKIDIGAGNLTADIQKASQAAMLLSAHLATATNPKTGNLDFAKFYSSIKLSGITLLQYGESLTKMGPAGQKAFVTLADSISKAEIPLKRTSLMANNLWAGLKRTASWLLLSSIIHGMIGSIQSAIGYAKDLNSSLNDIRIVTGQSTDLMAKFAREANQAAKTLSTTTTDYTKASLIYYQLGLSDALVKARTEATIKMANVNGQSAEKVSSLMTAIWNNFDNGSKSLDYYGDVITALGSKTASSSLEIAQGILKFAAISDTIGLSYEYAASALATVTATTRESADIVGNAYKTLFSRIQGLNLGETLDDGTTLNKYSAALSKVGISIKDSSGNLKDMDSILSEMGTKWDTLSKDLQTALALTVAGVRQYTLLVALMDNWDVFQKNLLTAKSSSGTLDSQAAIYAESWEAASDRVRASWEGLWDTLVDSEGMIKLLNFFSGFVNVLDKFSLSAGGLSGVLTSILGMSTKLFNTLLTNSLSNMAYNVGMLFGGKSAMERDRTNFLKAAETLLSLDSSFGVLYGEKEGEIRKLVMQLQLQSAMNYAENKGHMTPLLLLMELNFAALQLAYDLARILAAARYDAAKVLASDAYWDMYEVDKSGKVFNPLDQKLSLSEDEQQERADLWNQQVSGRGLYDFEEKRFELLNAKASMTRDLYITKLTQALSKFLNAMNNLGAIPATERVGAFNKALTEFSETTGLAVDETVANNLRMQVSTGQLTEARAGVEKFGESFRANLTNLIADDMGISKDDVQKRLNVGNRVNAVYNKALTGSLIPEEMSQEERKKNQEAAVVQKGTLALVSGALGLMFTMSAIQSLKGLQLQMAAIGDGASNLTGVLSSLTSTTFNMLLGFLGLNSAFTLLKAGPKIAAGASAAIMAALVAISAISEYVDKNTFSEKERFKALLQSDAEILKASLNSSLLVEEFKTQSEAYRKSIEKILSGSINSAETAQEIFTANLQALDFIKLYGLTSELYSKNSAGLIIIDNKTFDSVFKLIEEFESGFLRAENLSSLITSKASIEKEVNDLLKKNNITGEATGDGEILTFEDVFKAYGTNLWNEYIDNEMASGWLSPEEVNGVFSSIERQILNYQKVLTRENLAILSNVDSILNGMGYTLDGYQSFSTLGYEKYRDEYSKRYGEILAGTTSKDLNIPTNIDFIRDYLTLQGYMDIGEDITFDGKGSFTFKYDNDEKEGSANIEAVRKWAAELEANKTVKSLFENAMLVLLHLYKGDFKDIASGLMSLLTGGNFENNTLAEINGVINLIDKISKGNIQSIFGVNEETLKGIFGIDSKISISDWLNGFSNYTSSAKRLFENDTTLNGWFSDENNKEFIEENLTQRSLETLYSNAKLVALLDGEESANNFLNGITEVLTDSGLSGKKLNSALEGLLALDWSDTSTALTSAIGIIRNLGVELDTTTTAWQNFVQAMNLVSGTVPDFKKVFSLSIKSAGDLLKLKQGDTVSQEVRDLIVGLNADFANLFSKHYSGDYVFIGEDSSIIRKAAQNRIFNTKEREAEIAKKYQEYLEGNNKIEFFDDYDFDSLLKPAIQGTLLSLITQAKLEKNEAEDVYDAYAAYNDYYTSKIQAGEAVGRARKILSNAILTYNDALDKYNNFAASKTQEEMQADIDDALAKIDLWNSNKGILIGDNLYRRLENEEFEVFHPLEKIDSSKYKIDSDNLTSSLETLKNYSNERALNGWGGENGILIGDSGKYYRVTPDLLYLERVARQEPTGWYEEILEELNNLILLDLNAKSNSMYAQPYDMNSIEYFKHSVDIMRLLGAGQQITMYDGSVLRMSPNGVILRSSDSETVYDWVSSKDAETLYGLETEILALYLAALRGNSIENYLKPEFINQVKENFGDEYASIISELLTNYTNVKAWDSEEGRTIDGYTYKREKNGNDYSYFRLLGNDGWTPVSAEELNGIKALYESDQLTLKDAKNAPELFSKQLETLAEEVAKASANKNSAERDLENAKRALSDLELYGEELGLNNNYDYRAAQEKYNEANDYYESLLAAYDSELFTDALQAALGDTKFNELNGYLEEYNSNLNNSNQTLENSNQTLEEFIGFALLAGYNLELLANMDFKTVQGDINLLKELYNLGAIAGYATELIEATSANFILARLAYDAWSSEEGTTVKIEGEEKRVRTQMDKETGLLFFQEQDAEGNWTTIKSMSSTARILLALYEAAGQAFDTAYLATETIRTSAENVKNASGDWSLEEAQLLISSAGSLSEALGLMKTANEEVADSNGQVSLSALEAVLAWALLNNASDRVIESIKDMIEANEKLLDPELSDDAKELALQIYDEAAAYAELQAAIDEVAAARGLDAEAVAMQAENILLTYSTAIIDATGENEELALSGKLSAEAIADMAAEMLVASEATTKLKLNSKNLYKNINGKDLAAANKALLTLETSVKQLIGAEGDAAKGGKKFRDYIKNNQDVVEKAADGSAEAITELLQVYLDSSIEEGLLNDVAVAASELGKTDMFDSAREGISGLGEAINALSAEGLWNIGEGITLGMSAAGDAIHGVIGSLLQLGPAGLQAASAIGDVMGFDISYVTASASSLVEQDYHGVIGVEGVGGAIDYQDGNEATLEALGDADVQVPVIVPKGSGAGKGSDGGGGGGGGGKEPKKVANKRKSQTVKRYKLNDFKRASAEKAKKSEESKKDYLYGESKIAQMEKINKLAEKEARITADRIKESRQYLVEDRLNLIKYLLKYGFEAEFDADGFLANYEQAWTKVYEEIAALYEDNLLTDDEAKKEEELKVKLEELEGVLEDYENSLKELQEDIAAYEESLFSMYDNKVEALQHKVEFKIELSKDDLDYLDFWIESLGDSVYNALESIEAMGQKANALFDGLDTYLQGIADIMSLSDDPLQVWATGGIKDILTEDLIELLRKNRDGLADYMKLLIKLRDEIKDKVISTFDSWLEKLDSTLNTIEHYTSVLEHFKNMIDIVGKDSLGLSDLFMANLEQSAINLSLDSIDANKAYYENLVEILLDAQLKLDEARARGDKSSAEHWEEVVKTTTESMEEAQESLLTSLEDTLNLIATQFENNMERAVLAFNDAIYAHGGLEGLSSDYSMIRENADLMAADYEKIYELSKITRDINKTLDDTKIVAGKLKLISLLKEINSLQNNGVELSKYDLEYLQAKYELRLAEIELENAKNAKDTVRLSRDSEGNWSYIYTLNNEAVAEAELKYEDALYEMLKLSQEYLEEMSSKMLETSSAMMEEISNLRIQDFNSYEEYQAEIKRIQDKYAESLKLQENELNKAVSNSEALYELDWRNYNTLTGYKISESEKWIDKFRESTIGQLLDSDTIMSSFSDTFLGLTEILTKNLADSAVSYFTNIDKAFDTYGTSIKDFGKNVEESTKKISDKSKEAAGDAKTMATDMNDAFKSIAETVSGWQKEFSSLIDDMLEKIKTLIKDINEAIKTSANYLDNKNKGLLNLIGLDEAIELINATNIFGKWKRTENGTVKVKKDDKSDYVTTSFIDFNAQLVEVIDKKIADYTKTKTGTPEREKAGAELEKLFEEYWQFRNIIDRVYDPTNVTPSSSSNNNNNSNNNDIRYKFPKFTGFDTGGYTGEWGDSGKFAMLHEKELVLNKDDTKNFLDALNISKDVINSMIEMNAKLSSMAFGNLIPSSIQDTSLILEQTVTILAEFPNATDHSEIEEAFNNLINTASQYANRR